jgi:hypothetical protein
MTDSRDEQLKAELRQAAQWYREASESIDAAARRRRSLIADDALLLGRERWSRLRFLGRSSLLVTFHHISDHLAAPSRSLPCVLRCAGNLGTRFSIRVANKAFWLEWRSV